MGLVFVPLLPFILAAVPAADAGAASGIANAVQQVGGALGVAVLGAVFFDRLAAAGSYGRGQVNRIGRHLTPSNSLKGSGSPQPERYR